MPRAAEGLQGPGPTGKVERSTAGLRLRTRRQGQVTLEDSQEAVGSQVALRIVAELQSLRCAAAPPAGPLLSLRDAGICPGRARLALAAEVGAGWLKHRVLDAVTLHSATKTLPSTACKRRQEQRSSKYPRTGRPRRGQLAALSPSFRGGRPGPTRPRPAGCRVRRFPPPGETPASAGSPRSPRRGGGCSASVPCRSPSPCTRRSAAR